jgi:hypothetical protein
VPFMNSTTGAEFTALSIACLVSAERNRAAMGVIRELESLEARLGAGRAACRNAYNPKLI